MRSFRSYVRCGVFGLFLFILGFHVVFGMEIEDVMVRPDELEGVCTAIEGEHAVSIQAAVQYEMAGDGTAGIAIYGNPSKKMYQSFDCRGSKGTIYYYEFKDSVELQSRLGGIKAVIWGEDGPTPLHPEAILDLENVLAVVSSDRAVFFERLLNHRLDFPDIPDSIIKKRTKALGCKKPSDPVARICDALNGFLAGKYPAAEFVEPNLLFGNFWEIVKGDRISGLGYEVLYANLADNARQVAAFGTISPENEEERLQIIHQIVAQTEGRVAPRAKPAVDFARGAWGATTAPAVRSGTKSLAFINQGSRVYVRATEDQVILMTALMHDADSSAYVVATYPTKRNSVPSNILEEVIAEDAVR